MVRRTRSSVIRVHTLYNDLLSYNVLKYKPVERAQHITSVYNTIRFFYLHTEDAANVLWMIVALVCICTLCRVFRGS